MEKQNDSYSEAGEPGNEGVMVDYVIPPHHHPFQQQQRLFVEPTAGSMNFRVDRALSFADFGPKLGLHHSQQDGDPSSGIDPINFLKFPVLNNQTIMTSSGQAGNNSTTHDNNYEGIGQFMYDQQENSNANIYTNPVQLEFMGNAAGNNSNEENTNIVGDEKIGVEGGGAAAGKTTKRKRPRTVKTTEEVESQRMTHIAVERNRRKQMNEHLRVLRSLMPSSYVQRGDQASIIGGAIEFVRELEQLLQCLESQKRRRLYGDQAGPSSLVQQPPQPPLGFPPPALQETPGGGPLVPTHYHDDQLRLVELDPTNCNAGLLWEESAESKSTIAHVEVKMSGFNALIKILSRRRPGQLIKILADLEDLQFSILHTNITTIEQTVLYCFNVQVSSEARFTAEDIASSVQQIFTFIHANANANTNII